MARNHARIHVATYDPESGFTDLDLTEQGLYWMLIARRDISACGVVPYKPKVWAQRTGSPLAAVDAALVTLRARDYVHVDRDTDELWVRTFIHHDGVLAMPQMAMKMAGAFDAVDSAEIRHRIVSESLPPGLRDDFPSNLQTSRKQVSELLDETDAASYKPASNNPCNYPYDMGNGMGSTALVDNPSHMGNDNPSGMGTGLGKGLGKGSGVRSSARNGDASALLSQERVTGGPVR